MYKSEFLKAISFSFLTIFLISRSYFTTMEFGRRGKELYFPSFDCNSYLSLGENPVTKLQVMQSK
jgi:hypothetical protein